MAHIQDDIIVWGANREEHGNNLRKVLERSKSSGLKLNRTNTPLASTKSNMWDTYLQTKVYVLIHQKFKQ